MNNAVQEFVIHKVQGGRGIADARGHEVGRVVVSTYKWGPGNAIEKFVRESQPDPGFYLVTGDQGSYGNPRIGPGVFSVYEVRYPDFTITGTRSGGVQIYYSHPETPL